MISVVDAWAAGVMKECPQVNMSGTFQQGEVRCSVEAGGLLVVGATVYSGLLWLRLIAVE